MFFPVGTDLGFLIGSPPIPGSIYSPSKARNRFFVSSLFLKLSTYSFAVDKYANKSLFSKSFVSLLLIT